MSNLSVDAIAHTPVATSIAAACVVAVIAVAARPRIAPPRSDLGEQSGAPVRDRAHTVGRRLRRAVAIGSAAALAVAAGPVALGVTGVMALLVHALQPVRAARRRRATIERALPDTMDLLVMNVRAGLTPFQAVCDLATSVEPPVGEAFAEVVRRTERGQPFADALTALPERLGLQAGGLADVIAASDRHGLALGPVLDQLAAEVRATRRRLDQAEARKLPVRLSFPLVTCTLPSFVLLAIAPAVIAALSSLGATAW